MTTLFKVLGEGGAPLHGGSGKWSLPKRGKDGSWTPGEWMPAIEGVIPCQRGYHVIAAPSVGEWWGPDARILAIAEIRGERQFHGAKVAVAKARLVEIVTPEWEWLPLHPAFRALLMSAWRLDNPHPAEWPDWANLRGANLVGANLRGADLHGAYLVGANLRGADLRGADLRGVDLDGANLVGANLRGADLRGADLRGVDLDGANLVGADLGDWERGPDGYARQKDA